MFTSLGAFFALILFRKEDRRLIGGFSCIYRIYRIYRTYHSYHSYTTTSTA
ncbi:MAG: hypothetical protein E7L01_12300 [Paenibacillus macerans]|uniref:hypothetical protein n=1 Tax=Paenibacillus macerans TaxID=44252 RepID=UPI002908837E|nr:hypothetical protein [Paenibacillus macerans]MDU7474095.1 hypothetical protein [Paenibacillus macerans]